MANSELTPEPAMRKLRIFAFDPSVAAQYDMAGISVPIAEPSSVRTMGTRNMENGIRAPATGPMTSPPSTPTPLPAN